MTIRDWYSRTWGIKPENVVMDIGLCSRKGTYADAPSGYRDMQIADMRYYINNKYEVCVEITSRA